VHMLTIEAFNALLKTLEEPPEFVKFIFATTQPNKVLPTILSRCQRFDFRRIALMEIIAQLDKIIADEKIDIDKEVVFAIARASDGALRDAESLLDQLISFSKEKISLEDINSMLGIVQQDALFEITDKIISKDALGALSLFNKLIEEGKDINLFLANLIEHFRNLMIAKVAKADAKLIDLPQDICDRLLTQSVNFSLEEILAAFNILLNSQEMAKRMDSTRIPLEITLVKLTHDKKGTNPNPNPAPEVITEASRQQVDPPLVETQMPNSSLQNIKEAWQGILDKVSKIKMYLANYLNEGSPVKLERNILTVSFPKNYSLHKESLEKKENKAIIEKVLSEALNTKIGVSFTLSKEEALRQESQDNPTLKSALDAFGARVIRED